jgi:hypothetical protein
VTADFETWLVQVAPLDELDPGVRPAGAAQWLREIFDRRGPISVQELRTEGQRFQMDLAQDAVALVLRDMRTTTKATPNVELRLDDEYGLVVSYNGGFTTPAMMAMQNPEATREIADYLQGEIMEDGAVWTAWPTCRAHHNGLHAQIHDDVAVWYCRTGSHPVAAIGQLAP